MIRKIFSFFFGDFQWKLLCVALAVVLWILGTNMNNPLENHRFNIQLNVHNMDILTNEGFILVNPYVLDELINVGIRAPRGELDLLRRAGADVQAAAISPSIDFRALNLDEIWAAEMPTTVQLNVSINLLAGTGYEHFAINPRIINLEIDAFEREVFQIVPEIVGEVDSGLELRPATLSSDFVTITGARSVVSRIDKVRVVIDVWGLQDDTSLSNLPIVVLDEHGVDITDYVQLSIQDINASIYVWPVESIALQVEQTGSVASGFVPTNDIDFEPRFINVIGPVGRLSEIEYVTIAVDITDRDASFLEMVDVANYLPSGIFLHSEQDNVVAVAITIEPIEQRVLEIPRHDILIRGVDAIYQILTEAAFVRVSVSGPRDKLAQLQAGDVGLELDLRNLQIGAHFVVIVVNLPEGISLVQNPPSLHVQIHEPAAEDTSSQDDANDIQDANDENDTTDDNDAEDLYNTQEDNNEGEGAYPEPSYDDAAPAYAYGDAGVYDDTP